MPKESHYKEPKKVCLILEDSLYEEMRGYAKRRRISTSALINNVIETFLMAVRRREGRGEVA